MNLIPENLQRDIQETRAVLTDRFQRVSSTLPSSVSIDDCIVAYEQSDKALNNYGHMPEMVRSVYDALEKTADPDAVDVFNRCLMVSMMAASASLMRDLKVTDALRGHIATAFEAQLTDINRLDRLCRRIDSDMGAKNLGICRLRLLPFGAELLDRFSGVPRSALITSKLDEKLRALYFFAFRARGFTNFLEAHWDRRLVRDFTPEGFVECYRHAADFLMANPRFRGIFASTWWFDPVIKTISPELAHLQDLFRDNGAVACYIGIDDDSTRDATTFSPRRSSLYKAGEYQPQKIMLIWHRSDLIDWANRQ